MSGSILPNITYASLTQPLYALAGSGGGGGTVTSSFQQLYTSSIVASSIVLDNQILTAAPTELLLNGIALATTSNLSSIGDWAFDPALSNVDVNGNDVVNANIIEAGQFQGILGSFQEVYTSSLFASSIVVNELVALSTIQTYNYISTDIVTANTILTSTIVGGTTFISLDPAGSASFRVGGLGAPGDFVMAPTGGGQFIINAVATANQFNAQSQVSTNNIIGATLSISTINGYTVGDFLSSSAIPESLTGSTLTLNIGKNSTFTVAGDAASFPTVPPEVNFTAPYNLNITLGTQSAPIDPDFRELGAVKIQGGLFVADPRQPGFGAFLTASSNTDYNFTIAPATNLVVQPFNPNSGLIVATVNDPSDNKGLTLSNSQISPSSNYQQTLWVTGGPVIQTNGGFNVGNNLLAGSNVQVSTINGFTVSDFLSTSASQYDPNPVFSTIVVKQFVSTLDLEVSSINGHEINQNTVVISTVNTDALNAIQISSIVGDVQLQLVSTLSFSASLGSNSFSLGGIDLGLGNIFGQLTGGALGIMSLVTSGVALGTGVAALHQTRATKNITTQNFELVNGTTQLQISTIPDVVSTIYRFSSGNPPDQVVGSEFFISTISPAGTFIRSMSDPLNTVSSPTSTLQAFGQWVPLPIPVVSTIADWAFEPALSNVDVNGFNVVNADNVFGETGYFSTVRAPVTALDLFLTTYLDGNSFMRIENSGSIDINSAVGGASIRIDPVDRVVIGRNGGASALECDENFLSTVTFLPSTIIRGSPFFQQFEVLNRENLSSAQICVNAVRFASNPDEPNSGFVSYSRTNDRLIALTSTQTTQFVAYLSDLSNISTPTNLSANNISTASLGVSSITLTGLPNSTITIATTATAGGQGQQAGRLLVQGQDVDLGQNDLWAQQLRVGANNPTGLPSEVIFYSPNNTQRGLGIGNNDQTIRIQSTINNANAGYLLDTFVNPPFFSTINNSVNMMAAFPAPTLGVQGVSTISIIPNHIASVFDSLTQTVTAANVSTAMQWANTSFNIGGFTIGTSTIQVPVSGIYEHSFSGQFGTNSGGTNEAQFWLTKNGTAVANTNSIVSITNNGDTIGTVTIFDQAAAGDRYGWAFYSADNQMELKAFSAGPTPAIPSVIYNTKRIG